MANVWEQNPGEKPQVKSGWGTGGGAVGGGNVQASNLGMAQKSAAASYWENKTTEIFIPEMGDDGAEEEISTVVAEPPTSMEQNMTNLRELNKDFALNVPSMT